MLKIPATAPKKRLRGPKKDRGGGQARRSLAPLLLVAGLSASPIAWAASDFQDVAIITATINHTLERERSGVPVPWSNPETGNAGTVTAERTYFLDPATPCRDYRRTMPGAPGETVAVTGTGCRGADGHWRLDEKTAAETLSTAVEAAPDPAILTPQEPPGEPEPRWEPPKPAPEATPKPVETATREAAPPTPPAQEKAASPVQGETPGTETSKEEPPKGEAAGPKEPETILVGLPSRSEG